jgi:hypothetical protein
MGKEGTKGQRNKIVFLEPSLVAKAYKKRKGQKTPKKY